MTTRLSTKGQIVIPAAWRVRKGLEPGDRLELKETPQGLLLRKARKTKPKLIEKGGILVLQSQDGGPRITSSMVKELEAKEM